MGRPMSRSEFAINPQHELHVELSREEPRGPHNGGVLATFCFSDDASFEADSNRIDLCLPPIGKDRLFESWMSPHPVRFRQAGRVRISESERYAFAVLQLREKDPVEFQSLVLDAYTELLSAISEMNCSHIVKIWNYFDRINDEDGGLERYRQFSWARADAFEKLNLEDDRLPTGTAIGTQGGNVLSLVAFLSSERLQQFENPRQVSAYRYPKVYGPRSPKFSRAGLVETESHQLFIVSGTAAVIGHESAHPFDLVSQTEETFNNLALLSRLAETYATKKSGAELDGESVLRVYLRNPSKLAYVESQIRSKFNRSTRNIAFLHGDICRKELAIEIDGLRIN